MRNIRIPITIARFLLTLSLLFVTAHRLPAPISEETPTPAPKLEAVAKSKSKSDNTERAEKKSPPKVKQSPFAPFVGVWSGTVNGGFNSDVGLNVSAPSTTTLRVSNDGIIHSNQATIRANISPDGRALSWPYQYSDSNGSARGGASLRLIGANTATYQFNVIMTLTTYGNVTMKGSGTLTKQ